MRQMALFLLIAAAIFLFFPEKIFASVVINEFSSGTTADWVELYNTGTESAQLVGLRIRDSSSSNKKDLSDELIPGGFSSIPFSNWLNNDGDTIRLVKLTNENEEVLEEISYGTSGGLCAPAAERSIGRFPDGGNSFIRFLNSTEGTSNNNAQEDPCPTPSPTPTSRPPTSTPTSKPPSTTPTVRVASPTPTSSLVVGPTSTPTLKPTSGPTKSTEASSSGEILGEVASGSPLLYPLSASKGAEKSLEATPTSRSRWLPGVFFGLGLLLLFAAAFYLWYTQLR